MICFFSFQRSRVTSQEPSHPHSKPLLFLVPVSQTALRLLRLLKLHKAALTLIMGSRHSPIELDDGVPFLKNEWIGQGNVPAVKGTRTWKFPSSSCLRISHSTKGTKGNQQLQAVSKLPRKRGGNSDYERSGYYYTRFHKVVYHSF